MADDGTIRVKRPDGRYSRIPVSSLKAAVAKGYIYAPQAAGAPLVKGELPNQGDTGEGPIAQGLTTFERTLADAPLGIARSLKEGYEHRNDPVLDQLGRAISSLNPIATNEGSLPMNIGGTMANLLPLLISKEGIGESPLGKLTKAAADKTVQTPIRVAMQKIAGAGKEPVVLAERARLVDIEKAATKTAEAQKEWVQKAAEAKRQQAEAVKVAARKQALDKGQEAYANRLRDNIQKTFQTVKGRLDSRWHSLRTTPIKRGGSLTVLKDEPLSSPAIAETVDVAEKKFLQGSPESIKQFRDLMNWMKADEGMIDTSGGAKSKLKPITWDEARTHYSALGDRMFSGDLPGNVRQAIRFVRDEGLGKQLRAGAERAGALPQYESLLHDWSNFENDWKDASSVTLGGGSPLARALKAPSGATLAPQVLGKTGDLLMQRLGKYIDAGGSPTTAAALRKLNAESKSLPKIKSPELPPRPKSPVTPAPIDPVALRKKILTQYAARPVSWWDILPPRLFERPAMSFEAIRDWVARQPRKELEP